MLFGIQVVVRRSRGDSWIPPLSGLAAILLVQIGGMFLFGPLGRSGTCFIVSRSDRLIVVELAFALLAGDLSLVCNPVRFLDHFDSHGIARSPLTWPFIRNIGRHPRPGRSPSYIARPLLAPAT